MPATLLAQLSLCLAFRKQKPDLHFLIASFFFMIITLLITLLVEVPIDNQIRTWNTTNIPDNWTSLRATWKTFHFYRTMTSILMPFDIDFLLSQSRHNHVTLSAHSVNISY